MYVNKMEILARSKINICFENSIGSGYVTEKLLHSKIMNAKHCIGRYCAFKDFSSKGVYNYYTKNSEEDVFEWCAEEIGKEIPTIREINIDNMIFRSNPTLDPIKDHLRRWSIL